MAPAFLQHITLIHMAIEVTKRGELPGKRQYKGTCSSCRTEVKFLKEDGQISSHRNESIICVECPLCKNQICTDTDNYTKVPL